MPHARAAVCGCKKEWVMPGDDGYDSDESLIPDIVYCEAHRRQLEALWAKQKAASEELWNVNRQVAALERAIFEKPSSA